MIRLLESAVVCLLVGASLTGCGNLAHPEPEGSLGKRFTTVIPGTWRQSQQTSRGRFEMTKTYFPDGTAKGVLQMTGNSGNFSLVMPQVSFKSRWRVSGDVVDTYAIETSYPGLFDRKQVIQDRLVSVEQDRVETRALKDNQPEVLTRVR